MEKNTSDLSNVLNESRNVLYDEQSHNITIQDMYQLLLGMNERLTTIEKGMAQVNQVNKTLTSLVTNMKELKTKVCDIESSFTRINSRCDKNESEVSQIKRDNVNIGKDVNKMRKSFEDVNNNLQGLSDFMDDFKKKHETNVKDVKQVKSSVSKIANDLEDHTIELRHEIKSALCDVKEENDDLRNKIIDLQCRSMKNNLIFTGLRESKNENTEDIIRQFMRDELRITHWVELGNVHRFGSGAPPGRRGRTRPIVARYLFHKDLARVLSNTYRLKGKQYGVNQQYPDAIEQARKFLYPVMKQKRAEGCHVKLVRDVLYVDGQTYNEHFESINQTPEKRNQFNNRTTTPTNRPNNKRRRTSTPKQR